MMDEQKYLRQLCTRNKQVSELGKHRTLTFKDEVKACGRLCQICDLETRFLEITDWKLLQFAISPVL